MNDHTPATKADLQAVQTEMKADVEALKADVQALQTDVQGLKADVQALQTDVQGLKADVKALDARLHRLEGRFDTMEQRIIDRMVEVAHESETRLLTAFYSFAESNQKRLTQVEATDVLLLGRVATLENRMMAVEKRLNMPPAA